MLTLLHGKSLSEYRRMCQEAGLPPYMAHGVYGYVELRIAPGGFLGAVLSNDFAGAVGYADHDNGKALKEWSIFLEWCLPAICHGSKERVSAWLAAEAKEVVG